MRYLRLMLKFARASFQENLAYPLNFFSDLLYSVLNVATGVLGVVVLFGQIEAVQGWTLSSTLALLGVYLAVGALRNLVIGPSLEALAGLDGEVWRGDFDFSLLRPINTQFLVSFRRWRLFALFDMALALVVLGVAVAQLQQVLTLTNLLAFVLTLASGVTTLYAVLLIFAALVFWSPGFLFTWIFDGLFQMARYPLGLYPGWLRLVLTWIIPVGMITTIPAQALSGAAAPAMLAGSVGLSILLLTAASLLFRTALRRYSSASS
jgi:ABC-2 type transport system permease protein